MKSIDIFRVICIPVSENHWNTRGCVFVWLSLSAYISILFVLGLAFNVV